MLRTTGWATGLAAAILVAACQNTPTLPALLPTAPPGDITSNLPDTITASGTFETTDVNVVSEVGALITAMAAGEGDSVRAGQALVQLDDILLRAQRDQAQAALEAATAELELVRAGSRSDAVAAASAEVDQARAEAVGAAQAVTDTRAVLAQAPGLSAQVAQAEAQVKIAEQNVVRATADRDESQALRDKTRFNSVERGIQDQRLAAAQANLDAAQAELDGAKAYLAELQQVRQAPVDLAVNARAAESEARVARARTDLAQAGYELARAGATAEDIAAAEAVVEIARANLALLDAQLARYTVHSPMDGVVTRKLAQPGEVARAGAPLLIVSDLSRLTLKLYVPVTQVGRIALGQAVDIAVAAYPGETFQGAVTQIATEAEFTPSTVQTAEERQGLVFAVTVEAANPDGKLKGGMPADATFR